MLFIPSLYRPILMHIKLLIFENTMTNKEFLNVFCYFFMNFMQTFCKFIAVEDFKDI